MNEKTKSILGRVTPQEKKRMEPYAARCKLSLSEYIRKRALRFVPRAVQPDTPKTLMISASRGLRVCRRLIHRTRRLGCWKSWIAIRGCVSNDDGTKDYDAMATIVFGPVKGRLKQVINSANNPNKTT